MISNAHFWNAGARSYNPICLNPLLVLEKITPLPGSSAYMYKQYIDDIFFLWRSSEKELKDFINHLNSLHPFIKFKANYDINKKSVEFLNTIISINLIGFIKTDLFEKPGSVCNFLHQKFVILAI